MSDNLTDYRRGVAADGSRHAMNPQSPYSGMCGAVLTHWVSLFQLNHPLSCKECIKYVKANPDGFSLYE